MADDFGFSRARPSSSTPPIGSPQFAGFMDNVVAQSYRSNQFRPPSPTLRVQPIKQSNDGSPILKRLKVDFTPDEPITHLTAGYNQVTIATKDKRILTFDTRSDKQIDCDIARYLGSKLSQAKVFKLFQDPTGKFILISLAYAADNQPFENLLYVKQIQPLPKLKNHLISAVAWNYPRASSSSANTNSTGTILLGTTRGLVLQTEFVHNDETKFFPLTPGSRQYVKEIFDIGPESGAITGLEFHQVANKSDTEKSFVILVCSSNRLYRMVGSVPANVDPPQLNSIFVQNSTNYKDVPGKLNHSNLDLYYPSNPANSPPVRFAWLTEPGVMTSEIFNQLVECKSSFESNEDINLIYYTNQDEPPILPLSSSTPSGMSPPFSAMAAYYQDKPISAVVTNFHVIILFRHCIRATCILNKLTVYEEYFSPNYGNAQGMSKDLIKNVIWVYFKRAIFRYKLLNENKNIWKIYLDQKQFDLARKYSANDPANYDRVICEEAQHYFRNGEFLKSAETFAKSKKPFEDVSLMFMEAKCQKALKKYIMTKLEDFDCNQSTQLTMTIAWLLEIIISTISVNSKALNEHDGSGSSRSKSEELSSEQTLLDLLFGSKQVVDCIRQNSKLFYGLIVNYSDWETYIRVAKLIGDHDHVVQCYMDLGEYEKSLEIIKSVKKSELFYTYGHILMKRMPKEFVDALILQRNIVPARMISILIQENPYFSKCSHTIRYLEYCVGVLKTDSKVIHNYLFELYARHREEEELMKYLDDEIPSDGTMQYYLDLQLCLRLCTELKRVKTCVQLYSYMGLYDEAANLALKLDIELAKDIAKQVESDDHQKRLWLLIAKNSLSKNSDIGIAASILKECRLLKIEDILPFFPNNTTIDLKDAIKQSLRESSEESMSVRDGTYENIACDIRAETKAFRCRYSFLTAVQKCVICSTDTILRTLHVLPCGHLFHKDCVLKEIVAIDPQYEGVEEKLRQLALDTNKLTSSYARQQNLVVNSTSSTQTNKMISPTSDIIIAELDRIISNECIYCGSLLANSVHKLAPIC